MDSDRPVLTRDAPALAQSSTAVGNEAGALTADEHLLQVPDSAAERFIHSDQGRVLRLQSEFVQGFDAMAGTSRAVTFFGSGRIRPGTTYYDTAVAAAGLLGEMGFAVITGGGPGIMEAANRGASGLGARSVGMNVS